MSAALGVDVGTKRIGVAICEAPELPATPLQTIAIRSREDAVRHIVAIAAQRGAATIVVGLPLRLDGTRGPAADAAKRFVAALRAAFAGDVVTIDERLTTAAAARKLGALDVSGSKRRGMIDASAAAEILETYRARRGRG